MMENIQFKIILRSLWRDRAYTTISILSLVIGLTCSVLLVGFVMNEFRIARSVPDGGGLYLLREKYAFDSGENVMSNSNGKGDLAPALSRSVPGVGNYCVFHPSGMGIVKADGGRMWNVCYEVTPSFVEFFKPSVLAGDLKATLTTEGEIAVNRSFALAYFGTEKPLGEKLEFSEWKWKADIGKQVEERKILTVTSVIDDSRKGFMRYDILVGLPYGQINPERKTSGWTNSYYSFLKLNGKTTKEDFVSQMNSDSLFRKNYWQNGRLDLLSADEIYFSDAPREDLLASRDKSLLYIGGSVALAILAVACFNYINIGMVRSLRRLRCTGLQLVFGASGRRILSELILETGLQMLLSLGIALLLVWRVLPEFNGFMGSSLSLPDIFSGLSLLALVVLLSLVTLLPSLYVFAKLKMSSPGELLKRERRRKAKLVAGLVVVQFAISAVLLIWVFNIQRQMYFVTHVRADSERIVAINRYYSDDAWINMEKQLLAMPEVEKSAYGSILSQGAIASGDKQASTFEVDLRYFDLFGIKAKQGELFDEASTRNEVVVNEAFVKIFGIENPVGYDLRFNGDNRIIGVVEDFILDNSSREIQPVMFKLLTSEWGYGSLILKIREGMTAAAFSKIRALSEKIMPGVPDGLTTMEQAYLDLHKEECKMTRIIVIFTWISFILTCIGLFGLAWYSVKNRRKEIALRKINGAAGREIVLLLCGRFAGWILIAFAFAVPAGWMLSAWWLEQFVYRVDVSVWVFFSSFSLMLAVGMVTVIWQSWRAASENPSDSLKSE